MGKVWFVYENKIVSGPFSTSELQDKLHQGEVEKDSRIWWRGQRDWIPANDWAENLSDYERNLNTSDEAVWYALKEGHTLGPYTKKELTAILSNLENLSRIRVWKRGQEKWATVYQYNDISDELGITKRQFQRAPIIGEVIVNVNGRATNHAAAMISEGGMGINNLSGLKPGSKMKITLRSPLLSMAISATAELRYTNENYSGMMFLEIDEDMVETIREYVRQFSGPSTQYLKNVA
tara:strand:+ start:4161 stop:4868 length:708 start_codon:yes stop_codon:yes gene_type:complete